MDMKIDSEVVKALRLKRAWSQEQLAAASGLSLRTIQRIEKSGVAANESVQSLAAVFEVSVDALRLTPTRALAGTRFDRHIRIGLGFLSGAMAGLLLTVGGTASAVDYTVRSFLNGTQTAARTETRGDLRPVTVSVTDAQSREHARVRIVASALDNGNVRFDLMIYDCDARGCQQSGQPAMETIQGVPARVEWTSASGERIAYEFTPTR